MRRALIVVPAIALLLAITIGWVWPPAFWSLARVVPTVMSGIGDIIQAGPSAPHNVAVPPAIHPASPHATPTVRPVAAPVGPWPASVAGAIAPPSDIDATAAVSASSGNGRSAGESVTSPVSLVVH